MCRIVARDTEHLQDIVNEMLSSPAIRRSTSHIVLSRQVPPRTAPLVRAAGGLRPGAAGTGAGSSPRRVPRGGTGAR